VVDEEDGGPDRSSRGCVNEPARASFTELRSKRRRGGVRSASPYADACVAPPKPRSPLRRRVPPRSLHVRGGASSGAPSPSGRAHDPSCCAVCQVAPAPDWPDTGSGGRRSQSMGRFSRESALVARGAFLAAPLAMPECSSEAPSWAALKRCRNRISMTTAVALAILLLFMSAPRRAAATLGADVPSIAGNEHALDAGRRIEKIATGERHDLTLSSGLVIHEFVSPSGSVYAVTWQGPQPPNLREVLGPYFAQLFTHASRGNRNRLVVSGEDFEIRTSGHARWFEGRAWVPSLVPVGVRFDRALE
jgi:hypothetical protein